MGQTAVSGVSQPASGDRLESLTAPNPGGTAPVPGSVPLKRRSKLASITNIFKPWKWGRKKASEKFQETSALLERKMSTRQSREELIRKGVLKDVPDQAGSSEVMITNGHSKHAIPIRIQASTGSTLEAGSTDTTLPQEMDASVQSEKLSSSASAPPRLQPATNTNLPRDASALPGRGDTLRKSARHPDFTSHSSSVHPSQSCSFGVLEDSSLPSFPFNTEAETEGSQVAFAKAQSDCKQKADAPAAVSIQPGLTDDKTESFHEQAETNREELKSSVVEAGSSERVEVDVGRLKERSRVQLGADTSVVVIPSQDIPEYVVSDSDSDPVQYRNDSDEEDDEESLNSALANKIRRRDTLANKLRNRPTKQELEDKNILPRKSNEEWTELRQQIGNKLIRRLSQRPSLEELEQRNILRYRNEEEEHEERLEIRRRLTRKLSLRPTVAELQARRILRFNEYVEVTEAQDYDRRADKPWTRLTPADKAAIRKELNEFKSREMEVHEESRHLTRFHRP
ncbi:phosphatase and actin regulator 2 isoform X2 [Rhinoraja longicauda]